MPEETQTAEVNTSSAETTAAVSQTADQTGQAKTEANAQIDTGKTGTEAASTGEKKPVTDTTVNKESKPVSRRSAQYRIEQLVRENNALKQGKTAQTEQASEETETQTGDQPDISKLIAQEVERRLSPMISESTKAADDAELNELFSGDKASERSKYESKLRDMWKLPQYKDGAATDLYKIASFDDAVTAATSKAIEEYKKAEKEARDSSASGTSNTSNRTGKTTTSMTDEELLARNERVKAGQK